MSAEITEARVMLSSTVGSGSIGGQQSHSGGSHGSGNQSSRNPGGSGGHSNHSHTSGGHKSGSGNGGSNGSNGGSNKGSSNGGGSNNGGSNGQPGQGNNTPSTNNTPGSPPAAPSPAPASPPSSPTGTQPAVPTTPTLPPTTEPSASPAATPAPGDSATEVSTTPDASDASPQTEIPVESSETLAPSSVPAGATPANGDSLIAGERAPAELFAVALRFENDQRYDVDPSSADSIFAAATDESGGFIDIDSDTPTTAETEADRKSDPESSSQNSTATRQALEELAKREQPGEGRRRILGSATEGGFIELAATNPSDAGRRHPLLDDQTRRDRSSETDASIGRLIAFDSAGSEAWNAVVANYSISDDAGSANGAIMDAPQTVAASNIVVVALGAGVMLTSSQMTRGRWKSLMTGLLLHVRQLASRFLRWS